MVPLAAWLAARKDKLIAWSVQKLSECETLQKQAQGPARWFFDSLIQAIVEGEQEQLESLLRNWVAMCTIPIDGEPVGLLPVLSVFKQAIWQEFKVDPPEQALSLAIQLDTVVSQAVEYLSKVEAAALIDKLSHQFAANQGGESAEAAEKVKASFVSVAAHELKTPLTVIEGYANMLKIELPEVSSPRLALMVNGIESGINRLRELVEDLVDVSLIEMALLNLELQPVWLRRVLDIAVREMSEALKQRKLAVKVQQNTIPSKPIAGDPERLLQMFKKLLSNAIKYTPDGGSITIYGQRKQGFVDITIQDTGIGIAPENLERIFAKFSTLGDQLLHSSGKVKFKGAGPGLGLVIAKGIVEAHGGTIWVRSAGYNEQQCPGSEFHIMLPAHDVYSGEGMPPLVASAIGSLAGSVLSTGQASADNSEAQRTGGKADTTEDEKAVTDKLTNKGGKTS
jgi:signal transduction histidine kinase